MEPYTDPYLTPSSDWVRYLDWEDKRCAFPSFCTIALMPYLYRQLRKPYTDPHTVPYTDLYLSLVAYLCSIDKAIIAGLGAHTAMWLMGRMDEAASSLYGCLCPGGKPTENKTRAKTIEVTVIRYPYTVYGSDRVSPVLLRWRSH